MADFDPLCIDENRYKIGVGEISVVVRFFLAAHRECCILVGIPEERLLHNPSAIFNDLDLSVYLEVQCALDIAK